MPPGGSPAAAAWPMGSSTINNRTETLQLPAHLPFFLPSCCADVNVGCAAVPPWHEWLRSGSYPPVLRTGLFNQQILPLPYQFASSISVASHCSFFLPLQSGFEPQLSFTSVASPLTAGIWGNAGGPRDHPSSPVSVVPGNGVMPGGTLAGRSSVKSSGPRRRRQGSCTPARSF